MMLRCCKWCGLKERFAENVPVCVQVEQHEFETPTGADEVVASYAEMLKNLIDQNSDDVDDLASWARALAEEAARSQREVTLRLTREMRMQRDLMHEMQLALERNAAKRVTVNVVVRDHTIDKE